MRFNYQEIDGCDISFYQDNNQTPQQINFEKMKTMFNFVVIKAGQWYYADPDFEYNWREAKKAGLPRSSYFFGDKRATGKAQANTYWNLIKDDVGEGMAFIDYEGGSWTDWNELYNFIVEFQRLSGFPNNRIGIYTAYYYWMEHRPESVIQEQWFGKYPLWLAAYSYTPLKPNPKDVRIPVIWAEQGCLVWQTGTPAIGIEAGVESRELDYDMLNGGEDVFLKYFNRSGIIPIPPIPPTMFVPPEKIVMKFNGEEINYVYNVQG